MKSVLVDFQGGVQAIANPGEEFEIYEGDDATVRWVSCPHDDVTESWLLNQGIWTDRPSVPPDYGMLRKLAYGDIGEQLDMLYRDMKNGTNEWTTHIDVIKTIVPGPNSQEALEVASDQVNIIWGAPDSPAWTDINNNPIPNLLLTIGKKVSD